MEGFEIGFILDYIKQLEGVYNSFTNFTKLNPVVGGMIGLWLLGVVTYLFKNIPLKIVAYVKRYTTVSITLNNRHASFHHLLRWYTKEKGVTSSRTTRVTNGNHGWEDTVVSVGLGDHYFLRKIRPFKLSRVIISSDGGEAVKEEITISTLGLSQKSLISLITDSMPEKKDILPKVFINKEGEWVENQDLARRSWDSVILKKGQKEALLEFIEEFESNKQWYQDMGISYKTGILLSGPPGTGKTSLIKALASHLNKNLCVLGCASFSDEKFTEALASTPRDSIILLEDFDSIKATSSREDSELLSSFGVTLSGMLNAIDGVFSSDGRIIIGTTNHAEKIDPALLRPGRFDFKQIIGYADEDMTLRMFSKFYPDFKIETINIGDNISLAQVENCFLMNKKDASQALVDVENLKYVDRPVNNISTLLAPSSSLPPVLESDIITI